MAVPFYLNIYTWMFTAIICLLLFGTMMVVFIIMAKKTHMVPEFKAFLKGRPICLFYRDDRYCDWKVVAPEAGIIQEKDYGAFIINDKSSYIDKKTKIVMIPFYSAIGASINVKAAKLADDLQYMIKDEVEMRKTRYAIANNLIDDSNSINVLKTSISFSAIKNMMTALIPHNVNSKIEKTIAARLKGYGNVNVPQIALMFGAVLGAIIVGIIIIKMVLGK